MSLSHRIKIIASLCGFMTLVFVIDWLLAGSLKSFGIYPRAFVSLPNIFFAPFLHGSWWHLVGNLMGLAIFSFLCLLRGTKFFVSCSLLIIVMTGLLVWLFGQSANHIGASGWIFGLWSLSIALAWFERSFMSIAVGLFVVVFYGGMVFGVLPGDPNISFESHLFGAISGVVAASLFAKKAGR